jgi:hypothetical protein
VYKVLLKVGETCVAQEVFLRREGTEVGALALITSEVSVLACGEVDESVEVVFAVELEQRLKGGQTGEVELLCRLEVLDVGGLTLKNNLVLLVA